MAFKSSSSGSSTNSKWLKFIRPRSSGDDSIRGSSAAGTGNKNVTFDLDATTEYAVENICELEALWLSNEELAQNSGDGKQIGSMIGSGHIHKADKRGLELSIPELRTTRRRNIFQARLVVMQNQRKCNPERLAKLYHNEVRKLQRDAHRVGISDARAVGMNSHPNLKHVLGW